MRLLACVHQHFHQTFKICSSNIVLNIAHLYLVEYLIIYKTLVGRIEEFVRVKLMQKYVAELHTIYVLYV